MVDDRFFRHRLASLAILALAVTGGAVAACGQPASDTARPGRDPTLSPRVTASRSPQTHSPVPRPSASSSTTRAGGTRTRILFVRVGQGDAVVITSGSWAGLVDGGPPGAAGQIERVLARLDVKRLDALIVSHPHEDHIGGLPTIIGDYRPKLVLLPPRGDGGTYGEVKTAVRSEARRIVIAHKGQSFRFGAMTARVLSPTRGNGDANESSVVLLLNVAGRRILLTGDVTGANEAMVGNVLDRGPPIFVLKVAHHGSNSSTSTSFLDDIDPRFAVICVGPNSYGHPTPETIARLRAEGTRIYSTQKNGTITLNIRASGKATWSFTGGGKPVTGAGRSSQTTSSNGGASSTGAAWVYVTETGECYHLSGCRYLSRSELKISLKDAKAQGYRACSVCGPPR